jgi:glucose-6-phosphate 1-epimerase
MYSMMPYALPASAPTDAQILIGDNELPAIDCVSSSAHYRILFQGAQLLFWTLPDECPVVWISPDAKYQPGKSPRGGTPICWPWFGPHPSPDHPAHGLVRGKDWNLDTFVRTPEGIDTLRFTTETSPESTPLWPFRTRLALTYHVGSTLRIELETTNLDDQIVTVTEAIHTYFGVKDVRAIEILGLEETTFIDRLQENHRATQQGPVRIHAETDQIYLSNSSDCRILDPLLHREIHLESEGASSHIIWNPWKQKAQLLGDLGTEHYLSMVCVEIGNVCDNAIRIAPGETHRLQALYRSLPLST